MLGWSQIRYLIGVSLLLLPIWSWSSGAEQVAQQMPKDLWLDKVKEIIPEPICKGFMDDASIAMRLNERHMTLQACKDAIPKMMQQCQQKFYSQMPAMIDQEAAATWGRMLGECIGGEFASSYLYSAGGASPKASSVPKSAVQGS